MLFGSGPTADNRPCPRARPSACAPTITITTTSAPDLKLLHSSRRLLALLALGVLPILAAAAEPAPAASRAVPDTIAQRVAACIACHGREGATNNAAFFPRLAGKPEGYLFNQLVSFRDGRRFNSDMVHLVQHLSDDYLREMAAYFASLDLPYPAVSPVSDASAETLARGKTLAPNGSAVWPRSA